MGLSLGNSGRREVAAQGTRGREEGQQTAERKATVPSFPGGGKDAELNFKKKKKSRLGGGGADTGSADPQDARQAPRRLHGPACSCAEAERGEGPSRGDS